MTSCIRATSRCGWPSLGLRVEVIGTSATKGLCGSSILKLGATTSRLSAATVRVSRVASRTLTQKLRLELGAHSPLVLLRGRDLVDYLDLVHALMIVLLLSVDDAALV